MVVLLTMLALYVVSGILLYIFIRRPRTVSEEYAKSEMEKLRNDKSAYSFMIRINALTAIALRFAYLPVYIILKALKMKSESDMFVEFERIFKEAIKEANESNDIRQK